MSFTKYALSEESLFHKIDTKMLKKLQKPSKANDMILMGKKYPQSSESELLEIEQIEQQ